MGRRCRCTSRPTTRSVSWSFSVQTSFIRPSHGPKSPFRLRSKKTMAVAILSKFSSPRKCDFKNLDIFLFHFSGWPVMRATKASVLWKTVDRFGETIRWNFWHVHSPEKIEITLRSLFWFITNSYVYNGQYWLTTVNLEQTQHWRWCCYKK